MKKIEFNSNKTIGVQCLLHTLCNLRCKFCFETKEKGIREDTMINVDYIKQLPDEIMPVIVPIMNKNDINTVAIYIMGGELFSDNIPDNIFDVYREFLYSLKSKIKETPNIECKLYAISNGIFTNHERVANFLKEFNIKLILSYDPVDRFHDDKQKDVWSNTFEYFNGKPEHGLALSTLLTKRNINAYIAGDETFEKTGTDIFLDSNIYVPRIDYHEYLPNDEDLFNFYKWALDDGRFNISDVNNMLEHSLTCNQGFFYVFGEHFAKSYTSDCLEGLPFDKNYYYGKYADQIVDDIDCLKCKQPIGLQKRGCLMCEYYDHCSEMCWSQILFDKYEMSACPIQRVYRYLEENPIILGNYKTWRDQYEEKWKRTFGSP